MEKRKITIIAFLMALFAATFIPTTAHATADDGMPAIVREPSSVIGYVHDVTSAADAHVSKDESSQVKLSLKKGDTVFVIGSDSNWYEIFYKGERLYVKKSAISAEAVKLAEEKAAEQEKAINEELEQQTKELDKGTVKVLKQAVENKEEIPEGITKEQIEELETEYEEKYEEAIEAEDEAVAEAVERQQEVRKTSLIWKIVIGLLVVAIIGVSVALVIFNRKGNKEENKEE